MAYKEVSRVEIIELIRRWQAGSSIRSLSKSTGFSRATVRKYLVEAEKCGMAQDGTQANEEQLSKLATVSVAGPRKAPIPTEETLAPWAETLEKWIRQDHLLLTRVHELLGQNGVVVSYMSLRRFVMRRGWLGRQRTTVRMEGVPPGEVAEMDFGRLGMIWDPETGRKRPAWGLVVVLAYSRHSFVWPLFRQQLGDIVEALEAAWAFFSGVPRYLIIDNFPAAIAGADPLNPRFTRGFLEYAQHRGFFADPARVRHPQDKPHVESSIRYVRERFFKGGNFIHMADLRKQARQWCLGIAGNRVHGTTHRLPLVVFQDEEQDKLLPFDGEPYDMADWKKAKVHPDHHISYRYGLYSVPYSSCPPGSEVEVRGDSKLVRIYHRGALAKVHPRQPRGGRSTDPSDYPPERTRYTTRAADGILRHTADLGGSIHTFAQELLGGPLPWAKLRHGHKLLRLADRYTPVRLEAACKRALAVDLIDVKRVERILIQALEDEVMPANQKEAPASTGRFARPGTAFVCNGGDHD